MLGKILYFSSLELAPPAGTGDALGWVRETVEQALSEARGYEGMEQLHLYYADADGYLIFSVPDLPNAIPRLKFGEKEVACTPLASLKIERRFEAQGKSGVRLRVVEETRDVYTALEKFQAAYLLGWGGLFFARDAEMRTKLFRHFDPIRKGTFKPEEVLTNLSLSLRLLQAGSEEREMVAYRPVRLAVEAATLEDALNWS